MICFTLFMHTILPININMLYSRKHKFYGSMQKDILENSSLLLLLFCSLCCNARDFYMPDARPATCFKVVFVICIK